MTDERDAAGGPRSPVVSGWAVFREGFLRPSVPTSPAPALMAFCPWARPIRIGVSGGAASDTGAGAAARARRATPVRWLRRALPPWSLGGDSAGAPSAGEAR